MLLVVDKYEHLLWCSQFVQPECCSQLDTVISQHFEISHYVFIINQYYNVMFSKISFSIYTLNNFAKTSQTGKL